MAIEPRAPRLAVLIDADNASAKIVDGLFDEIAKIGGSQRASHLWRLFQPAVKSLDRRAVAPRDHSAAAIRLYDRQECLRHHAGDRCDGSAAQRPVRRLLPGIVRQRLHTPGFPYSRTRGRRLRIRRAKRPPESFRQACRRFTYTENLLPDAPANVESAGSKTKPLQPPSAAAPIIRRVLDQMDTEDGWAPLGAVGNQLANLSSDFRPPQFRLSQAQRSGPHDKCLRDRPSGRASHAHPQEGGPGESINATEIDR